VLAGFAQFDNDVRSDRTRAGMRAALELGRRTFPAPLGYDHHAEAVDELDVEGILAFAERVLPRASDLWVQASLDYKQRLQQLFFPEGIAFDGIGFNRTAVTAPLFNYLAPDQSAEEILVSRAGIEPSTRRLRVLLPSVTKQGMQRDSGRR
jgi:hypothetical protein